MSKVVLITGGSRGIGAAMALLAAPPEGYAVAVNCQANSLTADEVVRQIREMGGQAMALQADLANETQVLAMFERIEARARELAPQVPMQRPGSALEVAQAIVWLLSEDSSYTTGAMLDVAGGR